jgi:hypothetical protein
VVIALPRIWVFFYGTIMSPAVMKSFGVIANEALPAKLGGFDITIRPRPNLVRSERSTVFGSLMDLTHEDLNLIYSTLEKNFGITYLPVPVLAWLLDGAMRPALCYLAPQMPDAEPDPAFVRQLAQCVRALGLPEWYASVVEERGSRSQRPVP